MMENLYGIKGIRMTAVSLIEDANEFLRDHDGKIIDIKVTDEDIVFIYIAGWDGEVTEA
jgi:hypothetical protein